MLLPGAEPYPTKASLPTRFLKHGFTAAKALTLREIRRSYVHPAEQERSVAVPCSLGYLLMKYPPQGLPS